MRVQSGNYFFFFFSLALALTLSVFLLELLLLHSVKKQHKKKAKKKNPENIERRKSLESIMGNAASCCRKRKESDVFPACISFSMPGVDLHLIDFDHHRRASLRGWLVSTLARGEVL